MYKCDATVRTAVLGRGALNWRRRPGDSGFTVRLSLNPLAVIANIITPGCQGAISKVGGG